MIRSAAPVMQNASLTILFKCPTPTNVFEIAVKPQILLTFGRVQNPLCLPRKTTLQRPKVAQTWCASCNLTHFFNISSSNNAPTLVCLVRFDFEICFAPQRRALFQHLDLSHAFHPSLVSSRLIYIDMAGTFESIPETLFEWK